MMIRMKTTSEDGRQHLQTQVHGVTAAACDFGGPREVTLLRQLTMDMDSNCVVPGAILGGFCRDRQNQRENTKSTRI